MEDTQPKEGNFPYRKVNQILVVAIILVNSYTIVLPFLPEIQLWLRAQEVKEVSGLPYKTNLDSSQIKNDKRADIPKDNRLVVPKIALNEHIYEGTSPSLVHKGVWARPKTSTPPSGSNTVLVGHRFTYNGPATFYSLDKVRVGDKIAVYWQGKEYAYTVSESKVVPATAIEVESPTSEGVLTLYTCTPIWSAKDRLVVVAKLDKEPSQ